MYDPAAMNTVAFDVSGISIADRVLPAAHSALSLFAAIAVVGWLHEVVTAITVFGRELPHSENR
jgi:hypothetical protein